MAPCSHVSDAMYHVMGTDWLFTKSCCDVQITSDRMLLSKYGNALVRPDLLLDRPQSDLDFTHLKL